MFVYSYCDISIYADTSEARRFNAATMADGIAEAAQRMPFATVKFYQLPAD